MHEVLHISHVNTEKAATLHRPDNQRQRNQQGPNRGQSLNVDGVVNMILNNANFATLSVSFVTRKDT